MVWPKLKGWQDSAFEDRLYTEGNKCHNCTSPLKYNCIQSDRMHLQLAHPNSTYKVLGSNLAESEVSYEDHADMNEILLYYRSTEQLHH